MDITCIIFGILFIISGTMEFAGLNMGFWVAMGVVALIVVLMNVVFWCMPKKKG